MASRDAQRKRLISQVADLLIKRKKTKPGGRAGFAGYKTKPSGKLRLKQKRKLPPIRSYR
jgi:hypothetical protein